MTTPAASEVPCPVCSLPATEVVDDDGDRFTTCGMCGLVYVTPSYAEGPTLSYSTPAVAAERDAVLRELRESGAWEGQQQRAIVTDHRGQVSALGGYVPLNP